jgi:glycine/D-amino acid oxidase-like deaminating enzyme
MEFDFIIVGQGIAGSLLSHFLLEAEKKIVVIDDSNRSSSSNVAAGIIHPITGRRLVKTWLYDEAFPVAVSTYQVLEKKLHVDLFKQVPKV